jgi:hypothetical protein
MNSPTATRRHAGERSGSKPFGNGAKAALLAAAFFLPASLHAAEDHFRFNVTSDNRLEISRVPAAYSNLSQYSASVADSSGVNIQRTVIADISKNASKLPYQFRDNIRLSPSSIGAAAKNLLRISPQSIVGTMLLSYLAEKGYDYIAGQFMEWQEANTVDTVNYQYWQGAWTGKTYTGNTLTQVCNQIVNGPIADQWRKDYNKAITSMSVQDSGSITGSKCIYYIEGQPDAPRTVLIDHFNMGKPANPKVSSPASMASLDAAVDSMVTTPDKARNIFESVKTAPFSVPQTAPAQFDLPADDLRTIDQPETTTVTNPDGTTQTKTKTKALSTTSTQTGTTVADNTASVTQKTIETTTGPAGQTETKVTPVVQTPPKTVDDSPTPEASPINCKMLNNCDWTKETTLQEIKNGVGVTQPTEATDKKPAIQATDDLAKSQIEQFAKPDTPFDDWFNFMPHYTCVNPKLGNGVLSWTVPICDHIGMMQEVMNFLWTLTAIITNIYLFFSRKPNE